MTSPQIGVLALQGDVIDHCRHLESAGARTIKVRTHADLAKVDGLVVPGGESTTMSTLLRTYGLVEPLLDYLGQGLPVYGSCAGMIILAKEIIDTRADALALGAIDMTVRRNAFGRQVDSFERDLPIAEFGPMPMRTVFIRAPWVESMSPEVSVLASVSVEDDTGVQHDRAIAVRQGSALATSFHPEITSDTRVHEYFVDMVRKLV